jgi:hypothetical protein
VEFFVLSLWGALSDERPGLPFASLVICLCVHLLLAFLCFTHLPYIYVCIYVYALYNTYNMYKTSFSPGSVQQNYALLVAHATAAVWTLERS